MAAVCQLCMPVLTDAQERSPARARHPLRTPQVAEAMLRHASSSSSSSSSGRSSQRRPTSSATPPSTKSRSSFSTMRCCAALSLAHSGPSLMALAAGRQAGHRGEPQLQVVMELRQLHTKHHIQLRIDVHYDP